MLMRSGFRTVQTANCIDGIDIRNSKAVRDNASRRASAARADHDAVFLGEIHKIPYDQEIIRKTHIIDRIKLVIKRSRISVRRVLIAFPKSRLRNMPQVSPVRIPFRYFKLGQVVVPNSNSRLHLSATSRVLLTASGT